MTPLECSGLLFLQDCKQVVEMEKFGEESPRKRRKLESGESNSSRSKRPVDLEDSAVTINAIMVPPQGPREEDEPRRCRLLELPDHLIEFIVSKQDARGHARSKSLCRTMSQITKDHFFHPQRDKLAPHVEPVHSVVYLPEMTSEEHPRAWDAERRTWLRLPSLSFLPRGNFIGKYQPNILTSSAPGLLLFHYIILQPTHECNDWTYRQAWRCRNFGNSLGIRSSSKSLDFLCVCNPLTQEAVFVPTPPSRRGRRGHDAPTPLASVGPHILLHRRAVGRGFTLYDLSMAPTVLFKLHVAPAVEGMVPLGEGTLLSNAQWTAHQWPLPNGQVSRVLPNEHNKLVRYARSVVVDRLIRTLCLRTAAGGQFQAVFVDFNMDKDEWEEEVEVGGVPLPDSESDDESDSPDEEGCYIASGDVISMHMVGVGNNSELWLLHNQRKGYEESDDSDSDNSDSEEDEECQEQARSSAGSSSSSSSRSSSSSSSSSSSESGERKRRVDVYVYKAQANEFAHVDTVWVQVTHTVALGGVSSSTICFLSRPDRPVITYDVVTKRLSLDPPVGDTIPRPVSNYCLWPGAANFQLNPAPWI